jgi:sodium transport system ATP-binding protein
LLQVTGLRKAFGAVVATDGLHLDVMPGEVVCLLGRNGAGKTTALRCLATLLSPTAGTVMVDGEDVRTQPLRVRRRIGFLAASMGLYERLTAREMVAYFARLQGLEGALLDRRADEVTRTFGLVGFWDRYRGWLRTG